MGQSNHSGTYIYSALEGRTRQVFLEYAQCAATSSTAELEYEPRLGEISVLLDQ